MASRAAQAVLVASSDDYLLEQALGDAVSAARARLGEAEVEELPDGATPEALALELRSPSLFAPRRVLVARDVRAWLDAKAPPGAPRAAAQDPAPLVAALGEGVADEVAVVLGAWTPEKPKGPLVKALESVGEVRWVAVPPPPKPWEDVVLSREQSDLLRRLVERAVGPGRLAPAAERLLLDRLGFAPRLVVQEAAKLVVAAGEAPVDEELVRRLTFPRERSLEGVRDAVLQRDAAPVLDLLAAAAAGLPVNGWRGERVEAGGLAPMLVGQVGSVLEQLLVVRRAAVAAGLESELAPGRTGGGGWYNRVFKPRIAPALAPHLDLLPGARRPGEWTLSKLFEGAGRYREDELVDGLIAAAGVETAARGGMALEALSAWLARLLRPAGAAGALH